MTYRDRRERRADRLRGWAGKRETDAAAVFKQGERFRGDHAFNTQPGHIPERERLNAREDRAFESLNKAADHNSKADEIDRQARNAIYMDDADARERLEEKIAKLEAERDRKKAINREAGKHKQNKEAFLTWLATQDERTRSDLLGVFNMYQGSLRWVKYDLANIGGTITKERKRLAKLTGAPTGKCQNCGYKKPAHDRGIACDNYEAETTESITTRAKAVKVIICRYAGTCDDCANTIERGEQAVHVERGVLRCIACQEGVTA